MPYPPGARLFGDKGYISAPDDAAILKACGVQVIAQPRANMNALDWADEFDLGLCRHTIETVNSQLEKDGHGTTICSNQSRCYAESSGFHDHLDLHEFQLAIRVECIGGGRRVPERDSSPVSRFANRGIDSSSAADSWKKPIPDTTSR
jgi:hypothetical protein